MAKKDNLKDMKTDAAESVLVTLSDEPMYESEAYESPEKDEGMATTVFKPIGAGGPVPIVAPKHNTVQLQPIIVPLAVVPYMTQDTSSLRTEGGSAAMYGEDDGYAEAVEFERSSAAVKKKRDKKVKPRVFAAIMFVLSALCAIPFILANFYSDIGGSFKLEAYNIIGQLTQWANGVLPATDADKAILIVLTVGAGFSALSALVSLAALIAGRYPRVTLGVWSFIGAGTSLGVALYKVITKSFVLADEISLIVITSLCWLTLLLSVVFAVIASKDEIKREQAQESVI